MTSVLASRAACVPVPHTEHPADTGGPGRIQHARIVVGEQAAARIEPEALARGLPEARVFLGMAEIVRSDGRIEVVQHTRLLVLHRECGRMRIRQQQQALAGGAHARQEFARAGQPGDVRTHLAMQRTDIDAEAP